MRGTASGGSSLSEHRFPLDGGRRSLSARRTHESQRHLRAATVAIMPLVWVRHAAPPVWKRLIGLEAAPRVSDILSL